jgi:hypothetical protein
MKRFNRGFTAALFIAVFGFGAWYFTQDVPTDVWAINNIGFPVIGIAIGMFIHSYIFRGNK